MVDLLPVKHRDYWSDRLARRIKPKNIYGNMTMRARIWRGLVDWSWGIELDTPRVRRCRWFLGRIFQ